MKTWGARGRLVTASHPGPLWGRGQGRRGLWGMLWGKQGKEDNPLSLVEKPFYFRDQSCLPRLFNQLPGIACKVMVKAAPKSLPTAAGAGAPLLCYNLYIRQHSHYRCHQMTLNYKNINTHQDGNATTNCLGHASLLSRFSVNSG